MGCASSSPLINGGGPGGIVATAKETASKAATEVLQAGETAIHEAGEHVKGAVQNVTNEITGVLGGVKKSADHINEKDLSQTNGQNGDSADYKIIPLKDTKQSSVDESLENFKNNLLKKAQSFSDDTDKMADDIIKETEDLIRDAETGIVDCSTEMTTRITSLEDGTIEILNLEEPEIERILDNEPKCPPTPEATLNSMLSSDGTATVSENVDSAATTIEKDSQVSDPGQVEADGKRDASTVCPRTDNDDFNDTDSKDKNSATNRNTMRTQPDCCHGGATTPANNAVTFLEDAIRDSSAHENYGDADDDDDDDDDRLSIDAASKNTDSNKHVRHHWKPITLKLNSVELYVIGGSTNVDNQFGGINRQQNCFQHQDTATSETVLSSETYDQHLAKQEENKTLDDFIGCTEVESAENENDDSSERSLKGFENIEKLVQMERTTANTERESPKQSQWQEKFQDNNWENEWEENVGVPPACKTNAENFKGKTQSAGEHTTSNGWRCNEKNRETIMTDEMENDFHAEQAAVVVSEVTPENRKTEWEKLQDRLQKVPRRRSMYDLFYENDGDILRNLFKKKKPQLLFHFSESSGSSIDSL